MAILIDNVASIPVGGPQEAPAVGGLSNCSYDPSREMLVCSDAVGGGFAIDRKDRSLAFTGSKRTAQNVDPTSDEPGDR